MHHNDQLINTSTTIWFIDPFINLRHFYSNVDHHSVPGSPSRFQIFGFPDGPIGLLRGDAVVIGDDASDVVLYLNRGGCEALSYRSLRSLAVQSSQLERGIETLARLGLDGLVIYSDREDLLAVAKLAETGERLGCHTRIIAVPHGVSGELFKADYVPTTLGFDTARRIFTELTGQ